MRLEVIDSGPGIRAIHHDKLFQTFERLNAAAVSGIEGTGLGLAIAARLMQLMGGRIGYNDNPAGGSVFWLELPLPAADSPIKTEAVPPKGQASTRHLRVLVADDEALNRSIASQFLSFAGHDVTCVDGGEAAVEAAANQDFDVILMDVRMPGLNGMEATRRIRSLPAPRGSVRVVAVTAQAFAQQIEMCRQAGMDHHVTKPFTQAVLLAALQDIPTAPDHPAQDTALPGATIIDPEPADAGFDRAMLNDISASLPPAELAEHMQTLFTRSEALLHALRSSGLPASDLVEDVHRLAGGAGTFGFLSLAAAARAFEFIADQGIMDTTVVAAQLVAAIDATIPVIRRERLAVINAAACASAA